MKRALVALPLACLVGVLVWRLLPSRQTSSTPPAGHPTPSTSPVPATPPSSLPGHPLPLPPPARGSLRVSVFLGGSPVPEAHIEVLRVNGLGRMVFETLADGSQIVREIPAGAFGVTVKYKLCVSQFSTVKIESDRMSELRFDLLPGGLVSGTVVDRSGAPVPKTRVAWLASSPDSDAQGGPAAETDAEGRYRLEGVPLGPFRLHVYHLHFKHWIRENLSLRDPSDVLVVDAVLERGTQVSGRVVDEGGTAIPKARVMGLNEATFLAETDPEGRFTLYGLGDQTVSVSVTARGFGRKFVPAVAPDSSDVLIVLQKGAAVSARLDASPEPASFAVFLSTYEHAAGRDIRVPYRPEKDPKGGFVIRDLDPGIYRVEVDAPGYETLDKPSVTLTPGATEMVSIRLKKSP